jgi:hypothetical protein
VLVDTEPKAVRAASAATPSGRRCDDGDDDDKKTKTSEIAMLRGCPAIYGGAVHVEFS